MSRLSGKARICLLTLTPLVLICLVLTISQHTSGRLGFVYLTVFPAESPGDYPRIRSILKQRDSEQAGLQPGDVLLEADGRSLKGTGPFTLYAKIVETPPQNRPVVIEYERDGERRSTRLDLSPSNPARAIAGIANPIALCLVGALILIRAPRDRKSLPIFIGMQGYALNQLSFPGGPAILTYGWFTTNAIGEAIFAPMMVVSAMLWIDRRLPIWVLALPWLLVLKVPLQMNIYHEVWWHAGPSRTAFLALDTVMIVVAMGFGLSNYFHGNALDRRKLRWIILGLWVGTIPIMIANVVIVFQPELLWIRPWAGLLVLCMPLGFFMAIVRYDFMDIDRLIGATASVGLIAIAILAGILMVIPEMAEALTSITGMDQGTARIALSLSAATLIIPGDRLLRPRVERLFFRERYALQSGMEKLLVRLEGSDSPSDLVRESGEQLDALLQPELIAIYALADEILAPVFNRGRAVPPALPGDGSLVAALVQSRRHLTTRQLRRDLAPADRAAIEALGAEVLLPVLIGRSLQYVICLGTKHSGDIYTQTDLALLGRVADKIAAEMLRFDDAEIIRHGREMEESLRRYVPAAIADQLTTGRNLETGERDVTVLFVDIRGYTAISQGLAPDEIFSTVNRYTETVSRVVRAHGGSVVEFNGDGMMVVFGAPEDLPQKERAAVEAGREIVTRVAELEPATKAADPEKLSCGVGIATGTAFVGNIRAVDRYIWTAIGNTTNLAARLEALTRDVDASMVIDATTFAAAGDAAFGLSKKAGVEIRGRDEPQDIYLLPLTA